jgi:O-antigen/teichoic acid export membrane protein
LVDWQGPHAVGLFGVASRLASGMALATAAFSMAWGPYGLALPDSANTARLFGRVMRTYALLAVLISLVLAAAAPELVLLISGVEYLEASTMLPGLLSAAAMAGGFYVLLVAAGVSRRGRAVGLAAIAGAVSQVVATVILLPIIGLPGVGVGAALGQAIALVLLGAAIAASAHGVVPTVAALCGGGALVVGLQALNAAPESTQLVRASIVLISAGISGIALFRLLAGRREPTQFNPA